MRVNFAVCAEGVSLDKYSDKLSIFSVIDQRSSLTFPFWMHQTSLVASLTREKKEAEPVSGKILIKLEGEVDGESDALIPFQGDGTARVVFVFNLRVDRPGDLSFHLLVGSEELELYHIPISQIDSESDVVEIGNPA